MSKKIIITENQLNFLALSEAREGVRKEEWNEGDQILAMFHALYGLEELGVSRESVAEDVIGTSLGSLNKQSLNFLYLHTNGQKGYSDFSKLQEHVYEKYKDISKNEFMTLCRKIFEDRENNPEEAVVKRKKRQKEISVEKERAKILQDKGYDPKKMKFRGAKLKYPVSDEDIELSFDDKNDVVNYINDVIESLSNVESEEDIEKSIDKISLLNDVELIPDEIKDFINTSLTQDSKEDLQKLIRNLKFLSEYITETLPDEQFASVVTEIKRILVVMGL